MCGHVVEFLRSCYSCTRAVFRNAPEIVLPGRYYFVASDTPAYTEPHWYGSKNWMAGEWDHEPPLGERGTQRWNNGVAPARMPLPLVLGSKECLARGDEWPPPPDLPRTIIDGQDSRCFATTFNPLIPTCAAVQSIDTPAMMAVYARLIQIVYDENWTLLENVLVTWFGPPVTIHHWSAFGVYPARAYVNFGNRCWLVLISGTTNFQELALQSFASVLGPVDYGGYGTNATWQGMANHVLTQLSALGVDPNKPITFVGHSYGAAVGSIAAAQIRAAHPHSPLHLLTFGLPKPGNQDLVNILASIPHVSVVNANDIVHTLPPDGISIAPFIPLVPLFWPGAFNTWRPLSSYLVLSPSGQSHWGAGVFIDAGTLGPLIDAIIDGDPLAPIAGHPIAIYTQNLWMVQSTPTWPVPASVWNLLFPTFTIGGGLRGNGTGNNLDGILVGAGGLMGDGAGELP